MNDAHHVVASVANSIESARRNESRFQSFAAWRDRAFDPNGISQVRDLKTLKDATGTNGLTQVVSSTETDDEFAQLVDTTNHYIGPRTVSTPHEDSDGDILVPDGCILDIHRMNPAWYFEHGHARNELPIGKCLDPNGQYAVYQDKNLIKAGVSYYPKSQLAMQIFQMCVDRFMWSRSLHFTPLTGKQRRTKSAGLGKDIGWRIDSWIFKEGCDVGMPSNMFANDTVKSLKSLVSGRRLNVAGSSETMHPVLFKSLSMQIEQHDRITPSKVTVQCLLPQPQKNGPSRHSSLTTSCLIQTKPA